MRLVMIATFEPAPQVRRAARAWTRSGPSAFTSNCRRMRSKSRSSSDSLSTGCRRCSPARRCVAQPGRTPGAATESVVGDLDVLDHAEAERAQFRRCAGRQAAMTVSPRRWNWRHSSSPMPWLAPVTRTQWPSQARRPSAAPACARPLLPARYFGLARPGARSRSSPSRGTAAGSG